MAESNFTNPNVNLTQTQTTTDGKIELNSSSGPLTFDELEQVTAKSKGKAKTEKSEESIDLSSDDKKGSKPKAEAKEPKETQKTDDKKSEAAQEKVNEQNLEKARKLVKAKLKDSEIDLDEEAAIPVKINGKEELVSVKELMGNYSGKVAWDKKFTELSKKEKEVKGLETRGMDASKRVKEVFEEKDPTIRMFKMAQMAGVDPITYRQNFLNDNINLLEKWYGMSDDERKADALAYETQYHKHRADTLESSTKQQQAQREQQAKLDKLRASHQIPEDVFTNLQDQAHEAVKAGQLDESFLQPEKIVELYQKESIWNAIDAVKDQIKLPWSEADVSKRLLKLVDDSFQMGFKPEDVVETLIENWGNNKNKNLVEKIKEERQEFLSGRKDAPQATSRKNEPLFFDDII